MEVYSTKASVNVTSRVAKKFYTLFLEMSAVLLHAKRSSGFGSDASGQATKNSVKFSIPR